MTLAEVDRCLGTARRLLEGRLALRRVPSARAACWFTRRGLESLLPLLLDQRGVAVGTANVRSRLVCLGVAYADLPGRAADLASAWDQLSQACHHHAYELTPTLGEAEDLLDRVSRARDLLDVGEAGATWRTTSPVSGSR